MVGLDVKHRAVHIELTRKIQPKEIECNGKLFSWLCSTEVVWQKLLQFPPFKIPKFVENENNLEE